MTEISTLPDETTLRFAQSSDKTITVGPITRDGTAVDRTNKRLRIVVKDTRQTADASAIVDKNSVDDPTVITGSGAASTGIWLIDLSNLLPAPGEYWFRVDLAASSANDTDREPVAMGTFAVDYA